MECCDGRTDLQGRSLRSDRRSDGGLQRTWVGFLEPVYQEAMGIELTTRGIPFAAQEEIRIYYKGRPMEKFYISDMIVFGNIVVELKAMERLTTREAAQLLNYLKGTGFEVGVLINFGAHGKLEWKRMILTK